MTRHQEVYNEDCALCCAHKCNLRVGVRVILVDVVCVMLVVLIARVEIHVVFVAISCNVFVAIFSVVEMYSLHPPSVTVNCVSCYRNDHCNFAPNSL